MSIDENAVEITRGEVQADDARARPPGLMAGKRALITGVANERSIAWAISQIFRRQGADLVFTYPGEAMGRRVIPLVQPFAKAVLDCDVSRDSAIDETVQGISKVWDRLDVLVHSIASRGA